MIDFSNGALFKLKRVDPSELEAQIQPLLINGETIVAAFKAVRD